jgi:hypothetical protein
MTDDTRDDNEAEWEQLDEKVLLAQMLAELQRMNQLLAGAGVETSDRDDNEDATTMYRCRRCPETVPEDDRERHARASHSAPPGMVEQLFERVE